MAEQYHMKLIETDETVIFDKRHSLWEIWKNFIIGGGAIAALILLLTKFKPGPSTPAGTLQPGETNWGYIILISILALFFIIGFGALPLFKRRNLSEKRMFLPILVMVLAAGGWGALMWFRNSKGFSEIWSIVVWITFFVVIAGWLLYPLFSWFFSHFVLTDRRLVLSQGILNKSTMSIPLDQLSDIKSSQNMWERIFRYGDVVMETASEFGQQPFTNISHQEQQEKRYGEEITARLTGAVRPEGVSAAPEASPPPASQERERVDELEVVDRLKKLDEMRQSRALTEEEFQRAKQELLDKMQG